MATGFTRFLRIQFWIQIFQTFIQTFHRFPLTIVCLFVITFLAISENHNIDFLSDLNWQRAILIGTTGGFWFLAAGLFSESHRWKLLKQLRLALPVFALLCLQIISNDSLAISSWTLLLAVILAVTFAAYLYRNYDNASIWYFNYQLAAGLCFALLSALILCGGLSLILKSIGYLFEIKINTKFYQDIWTIGASFFAPAYFLVNVPIQFDYKRSDCQFPRGVHFIQNYVLTPLSLVYMIILYAYLIKILLQWELPQGNLGKMISIFGVIGIFTHLTIYPVHDRSTSLLSWFYRNFYKMMIVPLGLLILAIVVRLLDYGLTEPRYLIIICASWFALLIINHYYKGNEFQIRNVTTILAILAVIVSIGPWRIDKLPVQNQFFRLQKILIKNNLLLDNQYTVPTTQPDFKTRKTISSIVSYLISHGGGKKMLPWFAESDQATVMAHIDCDGRKCRHYDGSKMVKHMGIDFVNQWQSIQNEGSFYINFQRMNKKEPFGNRNRLIPLNDFDFLIPISVYQNNCNKKDCVEAVDRSWQSTKTEEITLSLKKGNNLEIIFDGLRKLNFDLNIVLEQIQEQKNIEVLPKDAHKLILTQFSDGIKARLLINHINGVIKDDEKQCTNIDGVLLLKFNN